MTTLEEAMIFYAHARRRPKSPVNLRNYENNLRDAKKAAVFFKRARGTLLHVLPTEWSIRKSDKVIRI